MILYDLMDFMKIMSFVYDSYITASTKKPFIFDNTLASSIKKALTCKRNFQAAKTHL